ncbi:undecaprenyl-phosphate glucose phosphotransferase [Halomonas sp. MCCC 1A17488]|uniref:undecaprenyl-phosphate glucose phosphotransferase n=1 Tax=unclassified Halomonas TaxID=2609666 RepID=UPI0018D25E30|nr:MULTISPECIES: undecaprenyl-phosphate glucose phosphotransferase [unclassified Halomonas]MCE8014978.1 undecaprenyl-phosphate glucose phosphotransferase [Halomonas sp. MCCC 1A17488]MCG3238311.1 undecaprenyl-phosphate glucose phosphotransferase [Halomonas sp. MCCC 1A17488]QPP47937.1 undecaprenyl-phosphate glucose phosphotransferase [Halomonas sp. SS10-MC5]
MKHTAVSFAERYPAQLIVPVVDFFALIGAGILAHWVRFGVTPDHDRYWLAMAVMGLLVIVLNMAQGGYSRWRITRITTLLMRLLFVWMVVAAVVTSLIYFAHTAERYSRLWVGMTLLFSFIGCAGLRVAVQLLLRHVRRRGGARRSVFLVGPGPQLVSVAQGMRASPAEGYSIAGIERMSCMPDEIYLERLVKRVVDSGAREVWICVPLEMGGVVRSIFFALRNHTAEVRFIPDFPDMQLLNHRMSEVAGHLAVDLSVTPIDGVSRVVKRLEDILLGTLFSLIALPAVVVIAVLIKLTSRGPVLFKQYRTGVNGKRFKVYKFRSMRVHQEPNGQVTQATKGDSRLTPIGAFLRRTSLDELPQFYNVLQGRMSIVGPRPHALAHNEHYKELVESYMRRHKVKPGITGWAQVNGLRGETDTLEKMQRRVECDLWYIDNWSLWLDLRIIWLTIFKGFINPNAY